MDPLASADVIWCENVSVSNKLFHGVSAKEHPSFNFRTGAQHRFLCSGLFAEPEIFLGGMICLKIALELQAYQEWIMAQSYMFPTWTME